ncbi:MAG: murein biosynthesis integral membrane protein MurJ [Desulfobacterales bacterium]|nr:murein biosynthesis integral membrane protein MurJ [Desulfobacterales bacterium]
MTKSLYKKVSIASFIMMSSVFLSRVIGIFREAVIAHIGGATGPVDAYLVAFLIPVILNHIVASGFLSITFIPIFSHYLSANDEEKGWEVFSIILTCFGSLVLLLIIIASVFTPEFIEIVAPGITEPDLRKSAIRMTRIIMPAQFFFFAGGLFMAVQFSKERFFLPALAPLLYNMGIIAGGVFLGSWLGIEGFSWGVLLGAFLGNFALQYLGARKIGMKFYPVFDLKHPELKKYFLLTLPLIIGLTMIFSAEFFFKFFGSFMPRGEIACLNFAFRLMMILAGFFGQAIGMAMYPFMTRLIVENKIAESNHLLNNILRLISLVIPFSVLMMVLRHEIILILYQHGEFDAAATELTSQILIFFLIGVFAFSAQTVVVRGFYAMGNTLFPAIFMTAAVLLSVPFYFYAMHIMGARGIALAVSLSSILQVTLLYGLWNKKRKNKESHKVYWFYVKIIIISLAIGAVLEWFKSKVLYGIDSRTFTGSLSVLALTATMFLILFFLGGYIFKIQEITEIKNNVGKKFKDLFAP